LKSAGGGGEVSPNLSLISGVYAHRAPATRDIYLRKFPKVRNVKFVTLVSIMKGFVFGYVCGALMFILPAYAVNTADAEINAFVGGANCRTAHVEDVSIWDRSMLISVKGLKFIMSAVGDDKYEICPVDKSLKTLDDQKLRE